MSSEDPSRQQSEPAVHSPSAGQLLRAAREARGIHLAMLSVNLKVSVRQLEALEADQYDAFKGVTFVRALALSVCRQLKTDPDPVLQALPRGDAPQALQPVALKSHAATVVTDPFSATGVGMSRRVLWLALLMVAVVGALIWWPGHRPEVMPTAEKIQDATFAAVPMGQASDPLEQLTASVPAAAPAVAVAAPASVPAPAPSAQVAAAIPPLAAASAFAPVVATPVVSAPPVIAQAPVVQKVPPLVIKVSSSSWVSVRDNRGQVAVRRQVKAGETLNLDVAAPFFVYASRAEGIELSWRGKSVDLEPHTQNNEVRLQIKP